LTKINGTDNGYHYEETCFPLGTDPFQLANASICLQDPKCAYQFCDFHQKEPSLPAFVLKAKTAQDVVAGLQFAGGHDIPVSVKTTGHSFTGSSMSKDSLLIWMYHFEKDGQIRNVTDSCGGTYTTVGIGGGETWDDVIEAVKDDYHVVTGSCRTVSAAGGWLQGHGLSRTARLYGLGVDQVVRMHVVLPNGTEAVADPCTNPDLFWAFRGGGGGTFGVVTHVDYKVHPVTSATFVLFQFNVTLADSLGRSDLVHLWLHYWVSVSPSLEEKWTGHFNGGGLVLFFMGSKQEAMDSYGTSLSEWFEQAFKPNATATEDS
jgi:FAD/FMN-containing dehydrogenase